MFEKLVLNMEKDILEKVAHAAHFAVTEEEAIFFAEELSDLLNDLEVLDKAPVDDWAGVTPIEVPDLLRDDEPKNNYDVVEILKDMRTYDNYIKGPRL